MLRELGFVICCAATVATKPLTCDESTRTVGKINFDGDDPNERLEYLGELCNGLPWGNGTMTWTYGATYQGEWTAGNRHGSGRYTLPAVETLNTVENYGLDLAEAEFLVAAPGLNRDLHVEDDDLTVDDDDESRLVKYHTRLFHLSKSVSSTTIQVVNTSSVKLDSNPIESDFDVFVGTWANDEMHGNGVYVWSRLNPEHVYFSGRIQRGQKHGYGKEVWKNGQVYDGYFEDGLKNGHGEFKFPTGSVFDRYVGNFQDDELHGEGVLTWKNGNVYCGQFLNGEMHGQGQMVWKSNEDNVEQVVFEGLWSNGFIRGRGSLHFVEKDSTETFEGIFEEVEGKRNFWLKFEPEKDHLTALIEQIF